MFKLYKESKIGGINMSKIVMFIRDEASSGAKEINAEFRKKVDEIAKIMVADGYSCSEHLVNSPRGFESVFEKNPDCQLVFTTENNREAQYQACLRGIPVLEWRCFTDGKVSLTNVEKDVSDGITSYTAKRM